MFPEVLLILQKELKYWHDKLSHFHPKSMFRQTKIGVPPSIFLYLENDGHLCVSCMFVTVRRRHWIKKGINMGPQGNRPTIIQ